jgi:hypothetical protein
VKQTRLKDYNTTFLFLMLFASISCNSVSVRFPIRNDVELIELHVCEQEITQEVTETEKQLYCDNTFSSDREELYLCGEVAGIKDVDAMLDILMYKDGVDRPIFSNANDNLFTNGQFCRAIPLPNKDSRGGSYMIEFRDGRDLLESIEFEIRD